jgi:hypothetical protein
LPNTGTSWKNPFVALAFSICAVPPELLERTTLYCNRKLDFVDSFSQKKLDPEKIECQQKNVGEIEALNVTNSRQVYLQRISMFSQACSDNPEIYDID